MTKIRKKTHLKRSRKKWLKPFARRASDHALIGMFGHVLHDNGLIRFQFQIERAIDNRFYLARLFSAGRSPTGHSLLLDIDDLANRMKCLLYFDVGSWIEARDGKEPFFQIEAGPERKTTE